MFQGTTFILFDWLEIQRISINYFFSNFSHRSNFFKLHKKIFRKQSEYIPCNNFLLSFATPFIFWGGFGCICLQHLLMFIYIRESSEFHPGEEGFYFLKNKSFLLQWWENITCFSSLMRKGTQKTRWRAFLFEVVACFHRPLTWEQLLFFHIPHDFIPIKKLVDLIYRTTWSWSWADKRGSLENEYWALHSNYFFLNCHPAQP